MRSLLSAAALLAVGLVSLVTGQPAGGNYELPMKTLVLTTQSVLSDYPMWIMNAMQQPFDQYQLVDDGASAPNANATKIAGLLKDGSGNPNYNSIVLETAQLGYLGADEKFFSALDTETWTAIAQYCKQFGVRKVVLASSPSVDPVNIKPYPGWEQGSSADAVLSFIDNDVAKSVANNVKLDATWRVGQVTEFTRTSYWYYPATVVGNPATIKPFMYLNPVVPKDDCGKDATGAAGRKITLGNGATTDPCTWEDPNWVAAFLRVDDGQEEMHFLLSSNLFDHHSFSVADIWFAWLVKGMWPGMRRVPLSTQIDDVFLSTGVYNTTLNRQALAYEPAERADLLDIEELVKWQDALNAKLPKGSRFVVELAYNGLGYFMFNQGENNLNGIIDKLRDKFFWVSHTWSHLDLYCPQSNCAKYGYTKYNDTKWELDKNNWFAWNFLFHDIPDEYLNTSRWGTWSQNSLVTPRISGLNLTDSIRAMRDAGIVTAVGDNSRADLKPLNIWHPFQTKVDDGTPAKRTVDVIPRFATRVYFDCAIPEQNAMEHNSIYGPNCLGKNLTSPAVFPQKCNTTTFKYPRDLTMDEILSIEAFEVSRNLLSYRTDPYMFHQANLNFFDHNGERMSLLTWWIEGILNYFTKYSNLPIFTLKFADLETFYKERQTRDECGIQGKVVYENGKATKLVMTSDKDCTAKLSTTTGNTLTFADAHEVEVYGPDRTRDVALKAGQETVIPFGVPPSPPTEKPDLPYPPAPVPNFNFDRRPKTGDINAWEAQFIQDLADLEREEQQMLVQMLQFSRDYAAFAKEAECKSDETQKKMDEVYEAFDRLTKPTPEAIDAGITDSWYREMESALIALAAKSLKSAAAITGVDLAAVKEMVAQHLVSTQDRLEDYGTLTNKVAYKSMRDSTHKIDKLPSCK